MIVIFIRRLSALLTLLSLLVVARTATAADAGDTPEVEARRLVHILGYIAADYSGAVSNGAVINADEYTEQIQLIGDAAVIAKRIQPAVPAPSGATGAALDLPVSVAKLQKLLETKASAADVATAAAEAKAGLIGAFRLSEAPPMAPSFARGKALYLEHCATCHGETGRADTARAATLTPRPTNFLDPATGEALTAFRAASMVRFGVNGTAMIPFTFLSEADQWDLAFYVMALRQTAAPADDSPTYAPAELAVRSDAELRADLRAIGVPEARYDAIVADLRLRAPYEDRGGRTPLAIARVKLDRARVAVARGERDAARGQIIDAYLEGIEPAEPSLRAADADLTRAIEDQFRALRGKLEQGAPEAEITGAIDGILRDIARAEALTRSDGAPRSFASTAVSSAGILLREGVEAALLIAALLGIAAQAGLADRRRYVHFGWATALVLGGLTWLVSSKIIAISGAKRELIEGVTAVLATLVLFYVSYSLLAKREVARWMKFLRGRVSKRSAAITLFGVALLAAYREAFETVLFYQALLASNAPVVAAVVGAAAGAIALVALVVVYTRTGRFAPPQVFFKISSYLLYALAIIFAGQGVAALQLAGVVPLHPVAGPSAPALGIHPTIETLAAQLLLVALAAFALIANRRGSVGAEPGQKAPVPGDAGKDTQPPARYSL